MGYGIWDWDGMGYGIWGWDFGMGLWDMGWDFGMGLWDMGWDDRIWDGIWDFPIPLIWVASRKRLNNILNNLVNQW
ncbi:hypothetical protein RhiirC2_775025 [Rhizophagus irregularis]|uniref:Uncharacterized protein n=1 Tax=Rhizophagus irregularis TaxID=588596 RepID=A0A2N1NK16_9GLOM|nr:hypothetical protein RhiirC2_775025 [Rhizophagus irregularis]